MQDPLKSLVGRDISDAIQNLNVIEGKAKQTGNPYTALDLVFVNGYTVRVFLDNGGKFAVAQAVNE